MTKQRQQVIKAESKLDVKKIELKKMIEKKENDLKMGMIESEMIYEKKKTAGRPKSKKMDIAMKGTKWF